MFADHGAVVSESIGAVNVQGNAQVVMPARPVSWPVQIGKPPGLAVSFQPRRQASEQVHTRWHDASQTQRPDDARTVLITGPSGVGKTQLAVRLFQEAGVEDMDFRLWVRADSRASVMTSFVEAAKRVQAPGWDSPEAETKAGAFLSWLSTTDRSWLVVFDNVVTPAELKGLWPTGRGRVLATTFLQSLAVLPGADARVKLGVFTPEDAHAYMMRRVRDAVQNGEDTAPDVLEDAAGLAEDLGFLPVALAQAISVVLHEAASCADYRKDFADRANHLTDLFPDRLPADEYERTVATTWSLAMEQAEGIAPAGLASALVRLVAAADPAGSPEEVFLAEPSLTYLDRALLTADGVASSVTAKKVRSALRYLHSLSLIEHQLGDVPTVRMHLLTQRAVLETNSTHDSEGPTLALADSLDAVWDSLKRSARTLLLANAEHLIRTAPEDIWWHDGAHPLPYRAASSMLEAGLVTVAIPHLQWVVTHATERLGQNHLHTLVSRRELATAYRDAGRLEEAIPALQQVIGDQQRLLGVDHPHILVSRNNLASALRSAGRLEEAISVFQQLLQDRHRRLGPNHPDTLTTRGNLASVYGEAGRPGKAIPVLQQVLEDRQRLLGQNHHLTLSSRGHLADAYLRAGRIQEAITECKALLADTIRLLGPDDPETLTVRNNLASAYWRAGQLKEAIPEYEALLEDRHRILGADHPHTLVTRNNLATAYQKAGQNQKAIQTLEQLLEDQKRVLGVNHPYTLGCRGNLAHAYGEAGRLEKAIPAFEQLLEDHKRVLGANHPHTLVTGGHLANTYMVAGQPQKAIPVYKAVIEDRRKVLGSTHPDTLKSLNNLANAYMKAGQFQKAFQTFEQLPED